MCVCVCVYASDTFVLMSLKEVMLRVARGIKGDAKAHKPYVKALARAAAMRGNRTQVLVRTCRCVFA